MHKSLNVTISLLEIYYLKELRICVDINYIYIYSLALLIVFNSWSQSIQNILLDIVCTHNRILYIHLQGCCTRIFNNMGNTHGTLLRDQSKLKTIVL